MLDADKDKHLLTTTFDESTQGHLNDVLGQAFSVEPEQMLAISESLLDDLNENHLAQSYEPVKLALESTWYYARAMNGIITGGIDNKEAVDLFVQAANGFEKLSQEHLRDLSIGMATYNQAIVDLQQLNVTQAVERFRTVEKLLDNAGKFSHKFKPFIDHIKPDMLFASALQPLHQLDFTTARTLIEEASSAAEKVANTYYSDEDRLKTFFQGYAHLIRAFYMLFRSYSDLQQFEYDRLVQDVHLIEDSKKARDVLCTVKDLSEPARVAAHLAETIAPLAEVIYELALVMKKIFESTLTPELVELREMRRKLRRASESAAKSGPNAIVFIRFSEQIANQIKNLERLARPKKKDFGIYSGLVASGIFAVLLLVTSWANVSLNLALGTERLITSSMVLALIAGFGFGAVKFKSLLFPKRQGKKDSS